MAEVGLARPRHPFGLFHLGYLVVKLRCCCFGFADLAGAFGNFDQILVVCGLLQFKLRRAQYYRCALHFFLFLCFEKLIWKCQRALQRVLMNSLRRKRRALQSSSMAMARTVSKPWDLSLSQPVSRLKSHLYFFDVPLG